MSRKRRPPSKVHSISCTDAEWERAGVLAERQGTSISRYMVECGLTVDPTTEAPTPPRLVLDEAEQRRLLDSVVHTAERTAEADSEEEVLTRIRNMLTFLVELRMREMVRDARAYELKALLTDLFGAQAAAATMERLPARAWARRAWTPRNRGRRAGRPVSRVTWTCRRRALSPSGATVSAAPPPGAPAPVVPASTVPASAGVSAAVGGGRFPRRPP